MKKNILIVLSIFVSVAFIFGCATSKNLDQTGPYKGDAFLYNMDSAIVNSYKFIDSFLQVELANNDYIKTNIPSVFNAANTIRQKTPSYIPILNASRSLYISAKQSTNNILFLSASNNFYSSVLSFNTFSQQAQTQAANSIISAQYAITLASNTNITINSILSTNK